MFEKKNAIIINLLAITHVLLLALFIKENYGLYNWV